MVLYGWTLEARDNLRRGWLAVPPASFNYIGRGAPIVVVELVYVAVFLVVLGALIAGLVTALVLNAPAAVTALLIVLLVLMCLGFFVVLYFLFAALSTVVDRHGIGAGFDLPRIWRVAVENAVRSWQVAGSILLGSLVAGAIPLVGFLFTPAAYLMACPYLARFDETR
jgi:hypothetical protein